MGPVRSCHPQPLRRKRGDGCFALGLVGCFRGEVRMKPEQVVRNALRVGGGAEDFALVLLQLGDPECEIVGVVRNVTGKVENLTQKDGTKLRP